MEDSTRIKVLNEDHTGDVIRGVNVNEETGDELIKQLRISMTNLKANFMDDHTGRINYEEMIESSNFATYRRFLKLIDTL